MADIYKTDEFGNKYRDASSFGKTTGQEYAVSKNTPYSAGTGLSLPKTTGSGSMYSPIRATGLQKGFNDIFGTNTGNYSGTAFETPIQQEFMAANPNAVLGANGEWTGLSNTPAAGSGLGDIGGSIASGVGAAANLANAYIGYKNYGLAKDKFAFEKASTNRNIENQAQQYNAELQNRGEIGLALGGASVSPEQRANTLAQMERQKISGAALG